MEGKIDKLAFRFFKLFARYESTLKERGYFKEQSGKIIVDWDRFANEVVGPNFFNDLDGKAESAKYILENPPMKQKVNSQGKIEWVEVSNNDCSVQALFGHLRRIRNNLFHGAKFNETYFRPKRSEILLRKGLDILEHYRDWLEEEKKMWLNH